VSVSNSMSDQEIIETIKRADALLAEYMKILRPAADELARRKSLDVYGEEGRYRGDLGCHEEGIQKICLHSKGVLPVTGEADHKKAISFDALWGKKLRDKGVEEVYVGGFY